MKKPQRNEVWVFNLLIKPFDYSQGQSWLRHWKHSRAELMSSASVPSASCSCAQEAVTYHWPSWVPPGIEQKPVDKQCWDGNASCSDRKKQTCSQMSCAGCLQNQVGRICLSEPESQLESWHLEARFIPFFLLLIHLASPWCFGGKRHIRCSAANQGLLQAIRYPRTKEYPVCLFNIPDDAFLSLVLLQETPSAVIASPGAWVL